MISQRIPWEREKEQQDEKLKTYFMNDIVHNNQLKNNI